jgi:mRNA-degrading endonuclease RelE of RelBE toxin-antitoxin system
MSYDVVLMPRAEAHLNSIPEEFRLIIETKLQDLAEAPVSLSRPAVFPYPPGSQLYEFDVDYGGSFWDHFAILFRYGQDESTLIVIGIGHSKLRRSVDPDMG